MKIKLLEKCALFGLLCAALFSLLGFTARCESIPGEVLRLHILANSDSEEDQALKLRVRDRILAESSGLMDGVRNRDGAVEAVRRRLPQLEEAARQEVEAAGYSYPVKAEMTTMYFSTRRYGSVTLPAGEYQALRITIGRGEGHNWWCMLFPALCLPAAEDAAQLEDVLTGDELQVVQGGYEVKFKVVELYEQLRDWLEDQ